MKKLAIILATAGIMTFSFAKVDTEKTNDTYNLFQCMVKNMTPKERRAIKYFSMLTIVEGDKDFKEFLNIPNKKIDEVGKDAGKAVAELMVKCKKEMKDLFINNPMQAAYAKYAKVLNGLIQYALTADRDESTPEYRQLKKALKEGINSNKQFEKLLNDIFVEKQKMEKGK